MQQSQGLIVNGNVSAKALYLILTKGCNFSSWLNARIKRYKLKEGIHYFKKCDSIYMRPGRKPVDYFLSFAIAQKIANEYDFKIPFPQSSANECQEERELESEKPEAPVVKKIRTIKIDLEDTDEEVCIILNGIKMLLNFGKA